MRALMVVVFIAIAACRPGQADRDAAASPRGGSTQAVSQRRSDVTITLDRTTYTPASTVQVTVTNGSLVVLGYNQCSSRTVERQSGQTWAAIPEPGRMCTMELRLLNPKETQTFGVTLPQNATAGTYRLVLGLSRQGPVASDAQQTTSVQAYSEPFQIR